MTQAYLFAPSDWDCIRLVVFDVDGTLYRQGRLRLRMARDLLLYTFSTCDLIVVTVLVAYRRIRERLANEQVLDFESVLIGETAIATSTAPDTVRAIVTEWVEQRPLRYLPGCIYPGLRRLFAGLRRKGKSIGILSDYPADAKLAALGLSADHIVTAGDEGVRLLKPHPRGLEFLVAAAGVHACETVVIGDRPDRDGVVARRVGARALIRSSRPLEEWQTFTRFDDALYACFFDS